MGAQCLEVPPGKLQILLFEPGVVLLERKLHESMLTLGSHEPTELNPYSLVTHMHQQN